jgi:hypothetical protein
MKVLMPTVPNNGSEHHRRGPPGIPVDDAARPR